MLSFSNAEVEPMPKVLDPESLVHKQRQRGGIAMQKIFFADRADLAIAKKTRQTDWPKPLFGHLNVVVWAVKEGLSTPVATTQAPDVNLHAPQMRPRAGE